MTYLSIYKSRFKNRFVIEENIKKFIKWLEYSHNIKVNGILEQIGIEQSNSKNSKRRSSSIIQENEAMEIKDQSKSLMNSDNWLNIEENTTKRCSSSIRRDSWFQIRNNDIYPIMPSNKSHSSMFKSPQDSKLSSSEVIDYMKLRNDLK